jgi:hypothetical protein
MGCVNGAASGAHDDDSVTSEFGDHVAVATTKSDGTVAATLLRKADNQPVASIEWASGQVTWNAAGVRDGQGATHRFAMPAEPSASIANELVDMVWSVASKAEASSGKGTSSITCSGETEDTFMLDGMFCVARAKVLEDCTTILSFSCTGRS